MIVPSEPFTAAVCADAEPHECAFPAPVPDAGGEKTLQSIREARDRVLAKNRELIDKLAQAEDRLAEMTYERDDAIGARDAAWEEVAALTRQNEELRAQISHGGAAAQTPTVAAEIAGETRCDLEEVITAFAKERDEAHAMLATQTSEIGGLRAKLEAAQAESARSLAEARDAHERFVAQQKKNVASLAEQLAAAQKARGAAQQERDALQAQAAEQKAALDARLAKLEAELAARAATAPGQRSEPAPALSAEPLSDGDVHEALTAMFGSLAAIRANPDECESIAELAEGLRHFARRAEASGLPIMEFIAVAGADFAGHLRSAPAKAAAAVPLLEKAVETLGWLILRDEVQALDTTDAIVYAVDDDVDNCECIATAIEKIAIQTKYSVAPESALTQIAGLRCDLIILDVDLPGMDGFELHARIRKMAHCKTTPIIFLSGHLSTRERLSAIRGENNHFVAKPYTLSELSLRVLMLIVEARLA